MSEYELLILLDEAEDSFTSMMQWWASVSLALMVVAHFAGDKLRLPLVISILFLYSSFTIMIQLLLAERASDINTIMAVLKSLDDLTAVGSANVGPLSPLLLGTMIFSYWGTYLAAVAYLLWRFAQAKQRRQEEQATA